MFPIRFSNIQCSLCSLQSCFSFSYPSGGFVVSTVTHYLDITPVSNAPTGLLQQSLRQSMNCPPEVCKRWNPQSTLFVDNIWNPKLIIWRFRRTKITPTSFVPTCKKDSSAFCQFPVPPDSCLPSRHWSRHPMAEHRGTITSFFNEKISLYRQLRNTRVVWCFYSFKQVSNMTGSAPRMNATLDHAKSGIMYTPSG